MFHERPDNRDESQSCEDPQRALLRTAGMVGDRIVAALLSPDRIRTLPPDKHRPVLTQQPSTRDLAEAVDKLARGWGTR
jgi:hypothetical protein